MLYNGAQATPVAAAAGLANWRFDFQFEVQIGDTWPSANTVLLVVPSGQAYSFKRQSDGTVVPDITASYPLPQTDYTLSFVGAWPSTLSNLTNSPSTWTMKGPDDTVWTLTTVQDASGHYTVARPVTMVRRDGFQLTFTYGAVGELTKITDSYGKSVTFTWLYEDPTLNGGNGAKLAEAIASATLPDGSTVKYSYDTIGTNPSPSPWPDRLSKVQILDSGNVVQDQTTYSYANTAFPYSITSIADKNGVTRWSVTYNSDGRAIQSTGPNGAGSYSVAYGAIGSTFTRTVTNPLGKQAVYNYTSNYPNYLVLLNSIVGQPSTSCVGSTASLTYDANNLLASTTDEEGRVTHYTRDPLGRPTQIVDAYGTSLARTTNITWDATRNIQTESDTPNLSRTYVYDTQGRLTSLTLKDTTSQTVPYSTNGQTRTWNYTWSPTGQLLTVTGPLGAGHTTTYGYVANGYLSSITNEIGQVTQIVSVNGRGEPTSILTADGVTTNIAYDALGRVTSITRNPGSSQAVTSFAYNAVGDVAQVTAPDGSFLQYGYDDARRVTSITNNLGESIVYTRDAAGDATETDVKSSTGTIVRTQTATFDELARVLKNVGAASQTTQHAYDRTNNEVQTTDPRNKVYGHAFDSLNRFSQETDPNSFHTTVSYNGKDEVTSVADARSLTTAYVRDGFGEIIQQRSPDTGTATFWFDAGGRVVKTIDARSVETDFTYDNADRILTKTFPASSTENVAYTYDSTTGGNVGVGRLTSVSDPSGSVAYTYNSLGQAIHEHRVVHPTGVIGQTLQTLIAAGGGTVFPSFDVSYAYDGAGHVLSMTYPSGRVVTYSRNATGRVTNAATQDTTGGPTTVISGISYAPFGGMTAATLGNGVSLTRTYDLDGQVTTIRASMGAAGIQNLSNGYDAAGNITSITDALAASRNQTFTYDNLNRLASASGAYGSLSYTYDGVGNRLTAVKGALTDTYAYSSTANRVSNVSNSTNTRTFSYLPSGQVSADARSAASNYTFSYDSARRLSTASLNGTTAGTYSYSADGHRVLKIAGATAIEFIYDSAGHLIEEADVKGAAIREYVWLDDMPVAMVDHSGISPVLYYVHADHLARPQKLTDASGTVVWDGIFDPFGNVVSVSGSATNLLMFPGQYYDSETQLSQNWHRDYDPTIGRYIESDPIGLRGGTNSYAYASGNALRFIDPTGELFGDLLDFTTPLGRAIGEGVAVDAAGGGPEDPIGDAIAAAIIGDALIRGDSYGGRQPPGSPNATQPNCPDPECEKLWRQMEAHVQAMATAYADMYADPHGLFWFAYSSNPGGALKGMGTWVGHVRRYEGLVTGLQRMVDQAKRLNCPIPPDVARWLSTPPPSHPALSG